MRTKTVRAIREEKASPNTPAIVTRGTLTAVDQAGRLFVSFPKNPSDRPVEAVSTISVLPNDVGNEVVLVFEDADLSRPVILGFIWLLTNHKRPLNVDVTADGKRVTVTAEEQIELRCGESSITLTRAGKVLIRGAYVLSRSSGSNRIKGGSVQIN